MMIWDFMTFIPVTISIFVSVRTIRLRLCSSATFGGPTVTLLSMFLSQELLSALVINVLGKVRVLGQ
ncbi:hypothetical protein PHJA_000802200 [Phtheirospermum japonicum]|uniref:Uncharacterized protein n=1 Tax=Phtheirospermum japonicum TaxID=374723 RepID=A0A830BPW6_9LAMI|nr:hypothetical protein PHJA_000802200 [Phtheirospermum japonicum]